MHAIIRQGNGKYYVSAVFGYFKDIRSADAHERYLEDTYKSFYVIWDEKKEKLIRWFAMEQNTRFLIPQVLVVDSEQEDWVKDEDGSEHVSFLSREEASKVCDSGYLTQDLREKCLLVDDGYGFDPYPEIRTQRDIDNLDWVSGNFHDAYIKEIKTLDSGELYVLFDGVWGCKIELWFRDDVEYDISSRDVEAYDIYWFGSTVILQDGFVYLVDDKDMTVEQIDKGFCYFKARHMKYHVIPN